MTNVICGDIFLAFLFFQGIFYLMGSELLCAMLFAIFSLFIAALDIKTGAVPRLAFLFAFPFFFALGTLLAGWNHLWSSVTGLLLGLIIFLLAFVIARGKLGLADVWYSALIGMMLGPWWWYAAIGLGCFTGIIYMIGSKKRQIPFIPFMAAGSITVSIIQMTIIIFSDKFS
jgi:prepilin signal peptidase PulO-like enzyme (type II secretory pathway)